MRNFSLLLLLLLNIRANATYIYQGVDIAPMVAYYSKQVFTLNRPIATYDWSRRETNWFNSFFGIQQNSEPAQDDPRYLKHIRNWAEVFWKTYGKDSINMYGYGLYLATDPLSTASYGGDGFNWRLLQIILPTGTRIVDFVATSDLDVWRDPNFRETIKIESHFLCDDEDSARYFFMNGGESLSPTCRALVKEVFDTVLKVDAMAYSYPSPLYDQVCSGTTGIQSRAFVLMRGDRVTSENLHVYNASSRLNRIERVRIQTLSSTEIADGAHLTGSLFHPLLWPDIEGEEKSPDINRWLLENKFGCDGKLPYADRDGSK